MLIDCPVLITAQPVNDELEYIKMRYKSPSSRAAGYSLDGPPYNTLPPPSNYNTLNTTVNSTIDRQTAPPAGLGTMERRRVDKYGDRQTTKTKPDNYTTSAPRETTLPWVHVTPSITSDYPHTVDSDEIGPPGYYQVMESRDPRRGFRRDKDSIVI